MKEKEQQEQQEQQLLTEVLIGSLILDDENPKGVKTIIVITQKTLCSEKNALYSYEK